MQLLMNVQGIRMVGDCFLSKNVGNGKQRIWAG